MKIVVVDDNQDILDTTAMVLELDGHEVVTVINPALIIETCIAEQPDLVFQDANMPRFDLLTHLGAVAAEPEASQVPVVIFSAKDPQPEALAYSFVKGYLAKPFHLDDLRAWTKPLANA